MEWQSLRDQARRLGIEIADGESPLTLLQRLSEAEPPVADLAAAARSLAEQHLYAGDSDTPKNRARLIELLRQVRRALGKSSTNGLRPVAETATARDVHKRTV